jgi:hypothetical protein
MKNLGKTIDQILKIEPNLEAQLIPIKIKWKKYPGRVMVYWGDLIKILNAEIGPEHSKRLEIQRVLTLKRKIAKKTYTFEPPTENETVVGVIPEPIECRIKKYDRIQIDIAKAGLEAKLTHNNEMIISLIRRADLVDLQQKKLWTELKDHFQLWATEGPVSFFIRQRKDGCLILTAIRLMQPCSHTPQQGQENDSFLMRLDPEVLKRFFKFLNIQPPPGFLPE